MSVAAITMARRLTEPFARGADTLELRLTANPDPRTAAATAQIAAYDFSEHFARFDDVPDPRYVLVCTRDVEIATTVTIAWAGGSTAVTVEAGTFAGTSVAIDLGPRAAALPRPGPLLRTLRMAPAAADGRPEQHWGITALLGNLAKLMWVGGWERDRIRRELARVVEQRSRSAAFGRSLDLLGHDLGVPRFVPHAHTFDEATLALLHLDETGKPDPRYDAEDRAARYRSVPHHGTLVGTARIGVPGRFGTAFAFRGADARLEIADHAELALAPAQSFTVECFVRPDATADGTLVAKQAGAGWELALGEFGRGLPRNLRWQLSDGRATVVAFADVTLSPDRFQHVAGTIDRDAGEALLYVDGIVRDRAPLGALGALTTAVPVRLGRTRGAGVEGIVDELRLSTVARRSFAPVLGESDDSYRRRIGIFERWTLPSPAGIQAALNEAVGEIAGDGAPLEVDDTPATLVVGVAPVRLLPSSLPAGGRIDALGRRRTSETAACGEATEEERRLGSTLLATFADPLVDIEPALERRLDPGEESPDASRMHARAAAALRTLLPLLPSGRGAGRLQVRAAFDPRADDLRAVGRGLWLQHSGVADDRLAGLAHVAGFDFVANRSDLRVVTAAVRAGERLTIAAAPGPVPGRGVDVVVGRTLDLTVEPELGLDTRVEWTTIACGAGRVRFETPTTAAGARVRAELPGVLTVRVEATRRGRTTSGTRTIRVGPQDLADGSSIGADGRIGVGPAIADGPDPAPFLHPVHLLHVEEAGLAFDAGDNPHRMQRGTKARLKQLLALLDEGRVRGSLTVHEAWAPAAAGPAARGRRLLISHTSLGADTLAARAHAAGFRYVVRRGGRVELLHGEEELLELEVEPTLAEGAERTVALRQRARPRTTALLPRARAPGRTPYTVWSVNAGTDSVSELDPDTEDVVRAIKVGHGPAAVAIDPSGRRLYTADEGSDTVSVVDLASGRLLAPIAVPGGRPVAFLHHPRLARLYVGCPGDATVRSLDTAAGRALGQVAVGPGAQRLALTRDGLRLWAACGGEAAVRILTAEPLAAAGQLALPRRPLDVTLASGSDRGWLALTAGRSVVRVRQDVAALDGETAIAEQPTALALADGDAALLVLVQRSGGDLLGLVLDPAAAELSRFPLPASTMRLDAAGAGDAFHAAVAGIGVMAFRRDARGAVTRTATWRLGTGLGDELTWIGRPFGEARARFASPARAATELTAERAGPLLVRMAASLGDHGPPYTFEVRLKRALERDSTLIRKDQYDLLMNVLNLLHPIGVEVRTQRIREHVLEVREGLLEAFPDYTYPNFRVSGPTPRAPGQEE